MTALRDEIARHKMTVNKQWTRRHFNPTLLHHSPTLSAISVQHRVFSTMLHTTLHVGQDKTIYEASYLPSSCLTTYQTSAFDAKELHASQFFFGCQHRALMDALVSYLATNSPECIDICYQRWTLSLPVWTYYADDTLVTSHR